MRNVVKGYQFSQLAVPKMHQAAVNTHFTNFHGPGPKGPTLHLMRNAPKSPNPVARRPGRNVGIKGGYKV